MLVKNPASASNARARKIAVTGHGGTSRVLLHGGFHMGSRIGRAYKARCHALAAHVGGQPSEVQSVLIDQAARLHLLVNIAWAEVLRVGAFKSSGELRAAFDAFRKAAGDERDVLKMLGVQRVAQPVLSLQEYLEQRAEQNADVKDEKGDHDDAA